MEKAKPGRHWRVPGPLTFLQPLLEQTHAYSLSLSGLVRYRTAWLTSPLPNTLICANLGGKHLQALGGTRLRGAPMLAEAQPKPGLSHIKQSGKR